MPKHFVNKKNIFCQFDRTKMMKAKEVFKNEKLRILYIKKKLSREISIVREQIEIAHFDIVGDFQKIASMGIGIEEEYHGLQFSRIMVLSMLTEIEKDEIDMNMYVYIDTDVSCGFWDKIGLELDENSGYEKKITLQKMLDWCKN
jgi:hypothetical protein